MEKEHLELLFYYLYLREVIFCLYNQLMKLRHILLLGLTEVGEKLMRKLIDRIHKTN